MKPAKFSKVFFTALKVFIVLMCTLLVLFIFFPPNPVALESAQRTKMIANGTGIYKSIWPCFTDEQDILPDSTEEGNHTFQYSTDYFIHLVTHDFLSVNWSFFASPKIPSASGKYDPENPESAQNFKPENNAWNVVADLSMDDSGTPFLTSRNLQEETLKVPEDWQRKPRVYGPPFDEEALVIIRMGGSGEVMKTRNILWKNINPDRHKNLILRP